MVLNPNIKNNKLPAAKQNFQFKSCKMWILLLRTFLKASILIEGISYLVNIDLQQFFSIDETWEKSQFQI